jgi:hypothetical protein
MVQRHFSEVDLFYNWCISQLADVGVHPERSPVLKQGELVVIDGPALLVVITSNITTKNQIDNMFALPFITSNPILNYDSDMIRILPETTRYESLNFGSGSTPTNLSLDDTGLCFFVSNHKMTIDDDTANDTWVDILKGEYIEFTTGDNVILNNDSKYITIKYYDSDKLVTMPKNFELDSGATYRLVRGTFTAANVLDTWYLINLDTSGGGFIASTVIDDGGLPGTDGNVLKGGGYYILSGKTDYIISAALSPTDPLYEAPGKKTVYGLKCLVDEAKIHIPLNDVVDSANPLTGIELHTGSDAYFILTRGMAVTLSFWKTGTRETKACNFWILT